MTGPSRIAVASEAFQAYLEGVRAHPDDQDLRRELDQARAELETAWLETTYHREQR